MFNQEFDELLLITRLIGIWAEHHRCIPLSFQTETGRKGNVKQLEPCIEIVIDPELEIPDVPFTERSPEDVLEFNPRFQSRFSPTLTTTHQVFLMVPYMVFVRNVVDKLRERAPVAFIVSVSFQRTVYHEVLLLWVKQ
ncbi:hypothetical protein [Pseudomonas aeruginosa]|uniref:hypothetical protein n=1 Tax=Pseudomonas aeruginosa TaxID=287 RepID=UPI00244997EB|nr:hypothetical protein [Pseudomonas aeruginosa]MDH1421313.1 hypothetical protein [Pseudomonas aeruginosa]